MGVCFSDNAATVMPLPAIGLRLDQAEVAQIISSAGILIPCQFKDSKYVTVVMADLKKFVDIACAFGSKYKLEGNDCDDFAFIVLGRVREYYARKGSDSGILFGYLDGDIRMAASDPVRGHAVCWFIDENKHLWIYDSLWNHIYPFEKFMTAWSILV